MVDPQQPSPGQRRPSGPAKVVTGTVRRPGAAGTGTGAQRRPGAPHPPPPAAEIREAIEADMAADDRDPGEGAPAPADDGRPVRIALIIIGACLAVGILLFFTLRPLRIHLAVSTLDACRDDAGREEEAQAAADTWFALVRGDRKQVLELVRGNHGPVPVQVRIAELAGSIPALLSILDRANPNPAYRQLALIALDRLTTPPPEDPILAEDIASRVAVWVRDPQLLPEASNAAMSIYMRLRPDAAELVLFDALRQAGSDRALVTKALDGLARNLRRAKFPDYLDLAIGVVGTTVRQHQAFYRGVVDLATAEDTERLLAMLGSDDTAQRVVAYDCLAGKRYALPGKPLDAAAVKLRERLGFTAASSMARDRHPRERSAAFTAARRLHLGASINAILQISRDPGDLGSYDVTPAAIATALGADLTDGVTPAEAEAVLARLGTALGDPLLRDTALAALATVRNPGIPNLDRVIARLGKLDTPAAEAARRNLLSLRKARKG